MPPAKKRTFHPRRTVLVVSGRQQNEDPDWPVVLVCPISSGDESSPFDVKLGAGMAGLRIKGWVRGHLVQPLEKEQLQECLSLNPLPSQILAQVHARVFAYMDPPLEDA